MPEMESSDMKKSHTSRVELGRCLNGVRHEARNFFGSNLAKADISRE